MAAKDIDYVEESFLYDSYDAPYHHELEYDYRGPSHHHHMDPSEAADFAHRKAASWEEQYDAMNREAAKRKR